VGGGDNDDVIGEAEEEDAGAVREGVACIGVGLGNMLEPGFEPDNEFSGREALALADAVFDGDGLGCAEGGDDLGGASPIESEKEGSVMARDSSARIGLAKGPGLKAVKGLL
jgi:hypothetical protein